MAILVHKSLKTSAGDLNLQLNSEIQSCVVTIHNCQALSQVVGFYCPQGVAIPQNDWNVIFQHMQSGTLFGGDFNAHHRLWSCKSDRRGDQIMQACNESEMIPINDGSVTRIATRQGHENTSPDITFISGNLFPTCAWSTINETLGSDHLMVIIKIQHCNENSLPSRRRNFKKADWAEYQEQIVGRIRNFNISQPVQACYNSLTKTINEAATISIPLINTSNCA